MGNEKHTSGPWEVVRPDDKRGQPWGGYPGLVALVSMDPALGIQSKTVAVVTDGRTANESEWEANARLIAAAPDLLRALKKARPFIECAAERDFSPEWHVGRLLEKVDAVLALVEGKQEASDG